MCDHQGNSWCRLLYIKLEENCNLESLRRIPLRTHNQKHHSCYYVVAFCWLGALNVLFMNNGYQ